MNNHRGLPGNQRNFEEAPVLSKDQPFHDFRKKRKGLRPSQKFGPKCKFSNLSEGGRKEIFLESSKDEWKVLRHVGLNGNDRKFGG